MLFELMVAIVKQTGGYIFVDSILGQGTEFTLIFHAIDADPITQAPIVDVTPKAKVNHGCGVILLVEDEAPVRTFASRALKLRGHQVIEAPRASRMRADCLRSSNITPPCRWLNSVGRVPNSRTTATRLSSSGSSGS